MPLVLLLAWSRGAGAAPARWADPKELVLPADYTPLTPEQLALTSVPFAPGAPAVVLLDAVQDGATYRYHRRVKILTEGGVQGHGDHSVRLFGTWTLMKVRARTVLPDGSVVDASDAVQRDVSKARRKVLTLDVAYPRVQVGAILDFFMEASHSGGGLEPWFPQEDIPVLMSRLVIQQPGLKFQSAVRNLPPEAAKPQVFPLQGGQAYAFTFRDVPPLPRVPFAPPPADIAQQLLFQVQAVRFGDRGIALPTDWKSWARDEMEDWDLWMKADHGKAAALAREVTVGQASAVQKADAVRKALAGRVTSDRISLFRTAESPDDVLEGGGGSDAEIAGLAAAMLRAAGVDAHLAAYRRKDSGMVPLDVFFPAALDSLLVGVAEQGGAVTWFSPTAHVPVGRLPWHAAGLQVVPIQKGSSGPVTLPAHAAADHRVERVTDAVVDASGVVRGTVTITHHRSAADRLRGELRDLTDQERREWLERELRRFIPDARLTAVQVGDPSDAAPDKLVSTAAFESQAATRAGQRLILNPHLFTRVSAEDWGAETRDIPIWWETPYEEVAKMTFRVPETVTTITLPQSMRMAAEPVGSYDTTYSAEGTVVTVERKLRLDMFAFPASSHAGLRRWFLDMAAADDQSVVLGMP